MNKKNSGGGNNYSAPFFLSKSAMEIFSNSIGNVLHPEGGVLIHNLEKKIKVEFFQEEVICPLSPF